MLLILAGLIPSVTTGCAEPEAPQAVPATRTGLFAVDYTIEGSSLERACRDVDAVTFNLQVFQQFGPASDIGLAPPKSLKLPPYADVTAACSEFGVKLDLPPDHYGARASLLGANGMPVMPRIDIAPFVVTPDSEIQRSIDFVRAGSARLEQSRKP